jgi:hypothetical protein
VNGIHRQAYTNQKYLHPTNMPLCRSGIQ